MCLLWLFSVSHSVSGFLADRLGRKPVFVSTIAIMAGGAALLTLPSDDVLWAGLVLFGLGWGGLYTLLQLLAADYFGPLHLGKILGVITVLDTFGGGLGPPLIGAIRDQAGSYDNAFLLVAGLVVLALLISTQFRSGKPAPQTATA